jgi:membrane associated rhomboid family serine protease
LEAGVTTVRDMGGKDYIDIAIRDGIESGILQGPRMLCSGKLVCMTGGHGWQFGREANGVDEGRRIFGNTIKYVLMGTSSNFGNMFSAAVASVFLPFLPMLPMQILLMNMLYETANMTLATDNVDDEYIKVPRRWNIEFVRKYTLYFGPFSSLYDFLTYGIMLFIFGDNVEDRMGHFRFLAFYLVSGVVAGLAHVALAPTSTLPTIGASGAIAGVLGAYIVHNPFRGRSLGSGLRPWPGRGRLLPDRSVYQSKLLRYESVLRGHRVPALHSQYPLPEGCGDDRGHSRGA